MIAEAAELAVGATSATTSVERSRYRRSDGACLAASYVMAQMGHSYPTVTFGVFAKEMQASEDDRERLPRAGCPERHHVHPRPGRLPRGPSGVSLSRLTRFREGVVQGNHRGIKRAEQRLDLRIQGRRLPRRP
jgi:hypothetical protein